MARTVEYLRGQKVVLTDRGWVFARTGKALTADEVSKMGRDPGLRDT